MSLPENGRMVLCASAASLLVSAFAGCEAAYGVGDLRGAPGSGAAGGVIDPGTSTVAGASQASTGASKVPALGSAGTRTNTSKSDTSATTLQGGGGASAATSRGGSGASAAPSQGGADGNTATLPGRGGVTVVTSQSGGAGASTMTLSGRAGSITVASQSGGAGVSTASPAGGAGGKAGVGGFGGAGVGGDGIAAVAGRGSGSSGRGGASSASTVGGVPTGGLVIGRDRFGIQMLYPAYAAGNQWHAQWDTPARTFNDRDPYDEWVEVRQGSGTFDVESDGALRVTGDWPRIDVRDPQLNSQWGDVEITIYFRRVADENPSWGGLTSIARTNHGIIGAVSATQNRCDTRGVGIRLRYDGQIEFVKETSHFLLGSSEFADLTTIAQQSMWDGGIPHDRWIGYKYVVYDLSDGSVKLELWIDETGGANGGTWLKRNEYIDAGGVFGKDGAPCASDIDPTLPLTNSTTRVGSETGAPNITVYFQSQAVATDGLLYKWGSVREIAASPSP